MKISQIKFGIFLQYAQMALSIIISLIYTPIMINILGNSEYGIYSLVNSVLSYLSLLSLGFGGAYLRFYSIYKKDNKSDEIAKLNGLYLITFVSMGLIALFVGMLLALNVQILFNDTYSQNDIRIAKILMIILSINLCLTFPASVFVSYTSSQEKFIFQKLLNIGKTVLSPLLNIAVLFSGFGSIGMVLTTTIVSILLDLYNILYCLFKLKMKFKFIGIKLYLFKDIAVFSFFIAINQIIDQLNWQTDKIVLGKMVNATAVSIYTVGSNINSMYINFSTAISSVFAPRINMIINSNEDENIINERLTSLFTKVGRIQFIIIALILSGFIFFGKYFVSIWAGPEYIDSYYVALLLICPVTFSLCQNLAIEIRRAKNKHQIASVLMFATSVLNIIISIPLVYFYSYIGAAVGTAISLLINLIIMNFYIKILLKVDVIVFWKNIAKICIGIVPSIIFGILMAVFRNINSIIIFIVQVFLYTLVYCISIYFLGMNKYEKSLIKKVLFFWRRK